MINWIHPKSKIVFRDRIFVSNQIRDIVEIIKSFILNNVLLKTGVIALYLEPSEYLVCSVIAILDLGITYVPIDVGTPMSRINHILKDCQCDAIITSEILNNQFAFKNAIVLEDILKLPDKNIGYHHNIPLNITTFEHAYIIYTSGSTGVPKGVIITYNSLLNFMEGMSDEISFSSERIIACFTSIAFDIFFLETIMSIYFGLTVVIADYREQHNPKLMKSLICKNKVDIIQFTPSRLQLLNEYDKSFNSLKDLKDILVGGEVFSFKLFDQLKQNTVAKIYNLYGPTETTIWSSISNLTKKSQINIGKPIRNTEMFIVDEKYNILPKGEVGQIAISGKGLAKGYINNEQLTNEKFICLPQVPEKTVYLTGDIGYMTEDDNFQCSGRMDNQIKLNGYRIELEEIESVLEQYIEIKKALAVKQNKILNAYYTSDDYINIEDIKFFLTERLPEYMIPQQIHRIKSFEYTASGKVDRKTIYDDKIIEKGDVAMELSCNELKILNIVINNIEPTANQKISLNSKLADIGMDSITFIKIIVSIEQEFQIEFEDEFLLITYFNTINDFVAYVDKIK